jgi:hypothetical protein
MAARSVAHSSPLRGLQRRSWAFRQSEKRRRLSPVILGLEILTPVADLTATTHTLSRYARREGVPASYCMSDWFPMSRRNGISGPTGMYS